MSMIRSSMSSISSGEWDRIFGRRACKTGGRVGRPALNPRKLKEGFEWWDKKKKEAAREEVKKLEAIFGLRTRKGRILSF